MFCGGKCLSVVSLNYIYNKVITRILTRWLTDWLIKARHLNCLISGSLESFKQIAVPGVEWERDTKETLIKSIPRRG